MVNVLDAAMERALEDIDVDKALVSKVVAFEMAPIALDVVEFWGVRREPLHREPVLGARERRLCLAAGVDRAVIEDKMHGLVLAQGLEALEKVAEALAVLARSALNDQLAAGVAPSAEEHALVGLTRGLDPEIGPTPRPKAREIRMRGGLGLIGEEQLDRPGLGLALERAQTLGALRDGLAVLAPTQRMARAAERVAPFFRNRRLIQGWERRMPQRRSTSCWSRGSVQGAVLGVRGSARITSSTSSARRPRCAGRPGERCVRSASTPPRRYAQRQCSTVSARTPKSAPSARPVQPCSESSSARARSASPRSAERVSASRAARCASVNPSLNIINHLQLRSIPPVWGHGVL